MAAWQVDFYVVPRRAVGVPASTALADTDWWAHSKLPANFAARLATVLAPVGPSGAGVEAWGAEDGNRVEIAFDDGRVSRVMVRVDVRRLDSRFGAVLLELVRKADAVLIRTDGLLIEPLISAFGAALRNSSAWRFANDPAAWVSKYASSDDEDASEE
jgi:hypothetical protein